jgi:hypothetical protein
LALKKLKKTPQKVAYLWQLGVVVFSAAPTAQNSAELRSFLFFYPTISGRISGWNKAIPDEWKAKSDIQRHSDRHIPQPSNFGLDQRVLFM